jgi:hypothetical protein
VTIASAAMRCRSPKGSCSSSAAVITFCSPTLPRVAPPLHTSAERRR